MDSGRSGVGAANPSNKNTSKPGGEGISETNTDRRMETNQQESANNNATEEMIEDADSIEPNMPISEDKTTELSEELIVPARIIGVVKAEGECKYVIELPRKRKEMAVFETFSTTEIVQMWPRLVIKYLEERINLY
eukprot:TRINITY_DN17733_c0_g1_i1.p2 TRINITY_DN17733_c0_g1~~TRINITY_DN17733_c0_g1_i1.p2  ORF type:complete len:136 (-),score=19.78 TRINITY_DN17733_c0_g1_i1:110-517(-)